MRVTINGHTFRTTIGAVKGVAKIPVSTAVRAAAGVSAGDMLDVGIEVDSTPRTVSVPDDLAAALAEDAASRAYFDGLPYSHQLAYFSWIEQAKEPGTRQARVAQTVTQLAERRPER